MKKTGVFLVFLFFISYANAQCISPENKMTVGSDTEFCQGNYNLPDGLIIRSGGITLNCNNAVISGNSLGSGILVEDISNAAIKDCQIENYEVGIYLKNSKNNIITKNTLSKNKFGIALYSSPDNELSENTFIDNLKNDTITYSVTKQPEEEEAIEKEITPEEIIEQVVTISKPGITDPEKKNAIDLMLSQHFKTNENLEIEREFIYDEDTNSTKIILRINPKRPFKTLKLYEFIPKCIGVYLSDIVFKDTDFEVVKEDPLIMWQFRDANKAFFTSYTVNSLILDECRKLFKAIGIGDILEEPEKEEKPSSKKYVFLTAVISMILVVIIIYFKRSRTT